MIIAVSWIAKVFNLISKPVAWWRSPCTWWCSGDSSSGWCWPRCWRDPAPENNKTGGWNMGNCSNIKDENLKINCNSSLINKDLRNMRQPMLLETWEATINNLTASHILSLMTLMQLKPAVKGLASSSSPWWRTAFRSERTWPARPPRSFRPPRDWSSCIDCSSWQL